MIARFVGAREPDNADRVLRQATLMAFGFGLVVVILGVWLARPAVLLLGAPADVVDYSAAYLRVASSVLVFSCLIFMGNACLRGGSDDLCRGPAGRGRHPFSHDDHQSVDMVCIAAVGLSFCAGVRLGISRCLGRHGSGYVDPWY